MDLLDLHIRMDRDHRGEWFRWARTRNEGVSFYMSAFSLVVQGKILATNIFVNFY